MVCSDPTFQPNEAFAQQLDRDDPLRGFRDRFHMPRTSYGQRVIYFGGNSLGLQPTSVGEIVAQELRDWAELGVEGHFEGRRPWYSYHEMFREPAARLVGARPGEVVLMNTLTVNLHLLMATFYRPTRERYKIIMDWPAFPSDIYALTTQTRWHGLDPREALVRVEPRAGEHCIRPEDIEELLRREGSKAALVLFAGVNYFTGQVMDIPRLTEAAHAQGCVAGFDLAHAAGNVELSLHDWGVDFAAWCNYKYLNSGPGAVAGCFIHERHATRTDLPRLGGWWGNDPSTRFMMHLLPDFVPKASADGWQVSNPPIFSLAPVKASYDIFDEATMPALRRKSMQLTGYLQYLIDLAGPQRVEVITPRSPAERGCQLSMLVHDRPKELLPRLKASGVICDFREPNVVRVAPVPLYNTFHDVWRFSRVLTDHAHG